MSAKPNLILTISRQQFLKQHETVAGAGSSRNRQQVANIASAWHVHVLCAARTLIGQGAATATATGTGWLAVK